MFAEVSPLIHTSSYELSDSLIHPPVSPTAADVCPTTIFGGRFSHPSVLSEIDVLNGRTTAE
jgi:hypothetical protein